MLEPDANVLSRWMTFVEDNVRITEDPKFEHYDHEPLLWWTTVSTTSVNTSANTFSVADGTMFGADDTLKVINAAGAVEVMLVSSVATNVVTVSRGSFESARISFATGANVLRLAAAYTEGDEANDPKYTQYTNRFNYIQTLRTPYGWTRHASVTKFYGGDIKKQRKLERAFDHACEIERGILWGELAEINGSGNNPRRTTRGLDKYISTNVFAIDGPLTEDAFNRDCLPSVFRYGSGEKLFLVDSIILGAMEGWGRARIQIDNKLSDTLGYRVRRYISAHGELMIVKHKLFETGYTGLGYFVDPANVKMVYLKGGKTRTKMNVHNPSYDGEKHEYITDFGLDVILEKTHGKMTGVTS